jgi:deoxyribodipyrimidine photo-lyase
MNQPPHTQNADAPILVWFRDDLRVDDNPALAAACQTGRAVLALFVLDDEAAGKWQAGGAARWWLHHSLVSLAASLKALGIPLVLRRGSSRAVLADVVAATGARAVHWNRRYLPWSKALDSAIKAELRDTGIEVSSHNGAMLREPWEVKTGAGGPFKVFTPFWRASVAMSDMPEAAPAPASTVGYSGAVESDDLEAWGLLPTKPNWAAGFAAHWQPGEGGALANLKRFIAYGLLGYGDGRNIPGKVGTSRLSPHLKHGEISVRRVWSLMGQAVAARPELADDAKKFASELGWREFAFSLLHHFDDFPTVSWKPEFERFPWVTNPAHLEAWKKGQTGYPIVDAGMRELWATGWMHNRVRMIVGSFLVKHLLLDWREGERWFWDTLVDADLANNAAGWQWIAGCGADAAPYFRVFNPMTQGEKFDADGAYVRRWVPELARMPNAFIHAPWTAPPEILQQAGVKLASTYPRPIVDHAKARERALAAYASLKTTS